MAHIPVSPCEQCRGNKGKKNYRNPYPQEPIIHSRPLRRPEGETIKIFFFLEIVRQGGLLVLLHQDKLVLPTDHDEFGKKGKTLFFVERFRI